MRNPITVEKGKIDGHTTWRWEGDLIDGSEDWLAVFHEVGRHTLQKRRGPSAFSGYVIDIASLREPWFWSFAFDEQGRPGLAKCDAAWPIELHGRTLRYMDLDIDLMVPADGAGPYVKDVDVFEANALYTPEHARLAWRGIGEARQAYEQRTFPFDGTAERLLGRMLAAEGPL